MSTQSTKAELQAALEALENEAKQIQAVLDTVKQLENRLATLKGWWHSTGEIELARRAIRDIEFPIYRENQSYEKAQRIIGVDDKWITMRSDGAGNNSVQKFRRKDGMEGQRKKWGPTIDVERALKIWAEHQAKLEIEVEK